MGRKRYSCIGQCVYSTNLFKTFDELKQDYNLPSITPCTSGGFMGQVFTPQN